MEDLEEISDTATDNGKEEELDITLSDDEHEEGEISDDEITVERVVKPLSSEVVIYDDQGRTAIFTSPNKSDNWNVYQYSREPRITNRNELLCKRKSRDYRDGTKHKRSKSKKTKRKSHHKSKSSDDKDRPRVKHRSPSSTSESDCSSCSSCSCSCSSTSSNSDVRLLGPKKTRGKENKQLSSRQSTSSASHFHSYVEKHHHKRDATGRKSSTLHSSTNPEKLQSTPRKLTQSYSPPHRKEVTRQSPPIYGRMKHSRPIRSPTRSLRPQSREPKTPVKVTSNRSKSRGGKEKIGKSSSMKRKESGSGTPRKGSRSGRLPKAEVVDLTLGDTKIPPPPGSLGEMLLRKTKKGKLKVGRKVDKSTVKDSAKEIAGLLTNDIIISSEKIVSVDGGDEEESLVLKDVVTVDLDQEDEDELQLRLIALKSSLKILNDVRREGRVATSEVGEAKDAYDKIGIVPDDVECSVLGAKMSSRNISKFEDTLLQCIFQRDAAGEFMELKEGHRIPNEEWGYELLKQEKAANKLIQDSFSNLRENAKDLSDSNQDIIDMEICDSSPEEDSFGVVDDVLKEVGEDIILDDDILIASHGDENKSQDGYQHNNFQIPVEWAYMMPPPPPPDQPDNDISNIHSWCYDQNMYLQSMQSTPCNATDQVAPYDAVQQSHLDWSRNSQANESVAGCYDGDEDQARENVGQAESIFCQDQGFAENERDLTNGLLDLPKTTYSAVDNSENKVEETEEPQYSGQESLKDQAAHQYQAFMNAMLQNHSTQTCTANADRNLVEVNLVKSPSRIPAEQVSALEKGVQNMNIVNNGRTLIKVSTMDKNKRTSMVSAEKAISTKAAARKRRKERKRLEKQKAKKKILIAKIKATVSDESESQVAHISLASSHEEEDEDLLRAQLLIDLSRKKLQKEEEEEKVTSAILERPSLLVSERIAVKHRSPLLGKVAKKVDLVENSPHCSFPSSAESSPKIRPGSGSGYSLSRRKVLQRHTNGKEGSPTHVLRKDSRSLSDIGGYSLDPKNSRYDFTVIHDLNVRKDVPKFKFPPIKPVIINMDSDSSDDEDDVEGMAQAGCSTNDSPSTSSAGGNKGSFSSSLDSLLKGIRAKSSPNDPLPGKPSKREGSKAGASNCPTSSTPNAVRHLSRTKQVEYHWLKEQLREKERLQRRLQQKKTTVSKKLKEAGSPSSVRSPSSANDEMHPVSSPCQSQDDPKRNSSSPVVGVESENDVHSCSDREVSLQEKGMIQIQLLNTSATADADPAAEAPEEAGRPGDDKSASASEDEDEDDEEALRLMVLQTIPKKVTDKSNSEKVNQNNHIKSEVESLPTNIKIVIHQNTQGSNESLQENNEHKAMKEEPTSKENISEGEKLSQKDKRVVEVQEEESSKAADTHLGDQLNKDISPIGENKELFSNVTNEHDIKETGKVTSDDDSKKELGSGQADDDRQREKQVEDEPHVKQSKPIVEIKKVAKKRVLTGSTSTQSKVVKKVEAAGQKGPVVQKDTPKVPKIVESNIKGVASGSKVISLNSKVISSNANGVSKKIVGSIISSAKSENSTEANDTKKSLALSEKKINEEKQKKINDERQKRLDLLERLKKEYIKKRVHTNEVILQLAVLVQEATDEERQRQSLKQNINKLRLQLVGMEAQYEDQSGLLKTKMERIRKLQNQMTEDRQLIKRLETKGELLGKQVLGSDYTLPKVFDSPKRKQTLANNISALRQQMRDVYNKNKAKLQAATISAKVKATSSAPPQVVGKQTDSSISSIQGKEGGASTVAINPKGNNKTAVKTLFQGETSSQASVNELGPASVGPAKRKAAAASIGPVVKKLAKSMSGKGMPVKEPSSAETVTGDTGAMPVQGNEPNCQTPSLEGRKKIDEMNELCPYDLLGRCNDDSCTYQHLGQQPRLKRPLSAALPYGPNVAKSAKMELKEGIVLKSESNPIQPFKSKEAGEIGTLEINNFVGNVTMESEFLDKADNGDKLPCRGENNSVLDESKELSIDSTTTFVHTISTDSTTSFVHTTEDLSIQVGEDVTVNSMIVASGVAGTDCSDNGGEKCLTDGKAGLGEVYTATNDVESLKERGVFEAKSVVEDQLKESRSEFQSVSIGEVDGRDTVTSPSAEKSNVCRILGDPALADTGNSRDSIVCCDAKLVNPMDQGSKESSDTVNRSLLDADDDSVMQNVEVEETIERNKRPNRNASDSQPAASACEEVKQLGISASHKSYFDGVVITAPDENQLADEANECIQESGTKDKAVDNMVRGAGDHNESSDAKENDELSIDDIAGCTEDGSQTRKANETDGGVVSNDGQCTDNCDLLSYTKDRTLSATEDKSLCKEACDRFSEASESHDSDLIHDEPKESVFPSGLDDDGNDTNRVNDTPSEDLDTHSDISSADVEQCDSRVKSSGVGVRSRQTSRRRRRPCASSVVCRRGRSSSSSATVGEGASSQGKANKRGSVRQVSTKKRKARGRPLGGRRGAR